MLHTEVQRFYDKALDWLLLVGPRVIIAVLVFIFGTWLIRRIKGSVGRHFDKKNVHSSLRPFFESVIFTALYVALTFLILQILGIQLTVFAAVIAAFGAAAGLALSGTLQNFASGIIILLLKPFTVGDNIIAQGIEGTVTSIRVFYTIITTYDRRTVIMPNSKLSNEVITNITRIGSRRLDFELKYPYSVEFESVRLLLYNAIVDIADVLKEPVPRIGVSALLDDGYKISVNMWLNAHGFEDTKLLIFEHLGNVLRAQHIK